MLGRLISIKIKKFLKIDFTLYIKRKQLNITESKINKISKKNNENIKTKKSVIYIKYEWEKY